MDKEQRNNFDNTFYNHQEEMKGIAELLGGQNKIQESIELLVEKVDRLTLLYTELEEKYVNQNNQLRNELAGRR